MTNNRYIIALTASILMCIGMYGQQKEPVTLEQLQSMAKENYPLLKQKQMYSDIATNKVKQLNSNFLPQASITGQATYQSEVTEFNFPIPGTVPFKQKPDQYAVGLELKENLFDYGAIKTQKQIEKESNDIQSNQIDADILKLKERINQLYGNIYLQQENKKIMFLRINELDAKRRKMKSSVDNGAALQSNFLVLESEYLSTQQKIEEINSNLIVWFKTLSLYTNKTLDTSYVLAETGKVKEIQSVIMRPEFKMFELQSSSLKLREKMINRNNLPKLYVFGRGYYGRPGYNFLNNDFRPYGMVGAGLNWNLTAYYTSGRDKKNLSINNDIVSNQKKIFEINLQSTMIQQQEEITKLEKMIVLDKKISDTKTAIRKASSSQLDNGIITSSDFIVDLNAENQAQFNLKLHEIQLMMAKENYNTTLGY
ncbi:MAG: TolC family protein [Bacteroidetes bacterium]|nr:TolC family protein [Bacteroidota bacterium]